MRAHSRSWARDRRECRLAEASSAIEAFLSDFCSKRKPAAIPAAERGSRTCEWEGEGGVNGKGREV